jgi:hypothetical protein
VPHLLSSSAAPILTASFSFVLNRPIHPPLGDIKVLSIGIEARLSILGLLAFLSTTTINRITPTNSNDTRNDMVIINLSLLQ